MKLSNRSYAKDVSRQLAEMGLERALRSFNSNTFSTWTHPNTTTSTQSFTVSSSNYGSSGISTAINIRVDHYLNINKATVWSALTDYSINDFVSYQGVWYICINAPPANQTPADTFYWKSAPEPWGASINYQVGNIAVFGGTAYRCIAANINQSPPNAAYWTAHSISAWTSTSAYSADDVAFLGGVPYRCILGHTNHSPPDATYWLSAPVIYSEGVATLPNGSAVIKTQLRALIAPAPLFPNATGATTLVSLAAAGIVDSYNLPLTSNWNSAIAYVPGDVVRSAATLYRCIVANTNNIPPNATFWATSPLGYSAVLAGGNSSGTAVSVFSAAMGGYVAAPSSPTPPHAPWVSFGGSASLTNSNGSVNSPHTTAANVDLTRISRSPYIPQFDIQTISSGTNLPASAGAGTYLNQGAISLGTAGAATPAIYNITATYDGGTPYAGLDLYQSNHDLTIVGPVILNVTGLFRVYQGSITIASTGSLEVYFTGQLDIGHQSFAAAGIDNNTNDPKKMLIVGTNSTNTAAYNYLRTRRPFAGLIYMPNAYLHMWNSTFSNQLYGALSARNIYFQHTVNLHYDTSLRTAGRIGTFIDAPYIITELRELTDPSERITLP